MSQTKPHDTSHGGMLHALKWSAASNVAQEVVSSLVTFLLAALLKPAEFGTVAMAYIYISFLQMVLGFGFNAALIQRHDLRKSHLDSVFWLNLGSGAVFAFLAVLLSGWWSHVTRMPDLQPMIVVLSLLLPVQGLSLVQVALLQKKMDFKGLAIRDNIATVVGALTGVTMAFLGSGGWALVGQHVSRELTSVVLLWRISEWRPGLSFCRSSIRELSGYAAKTFGGQLGTFAQSQTDSLLIGFLLGPAPLGIYRFADRLVEMVLKFLPRAMQIISLPHFSRLQNNLPELNRSFLFGTHLNGILTFPAMAFLAGASSIIVAAIGPQWVPAAPVLQILTLIGVSKAATLMVGPLLQALSRPGTHTLNVWTLAISNSLAVCLAAWIFRGAPVNQQVALLAAMRTAVFAGIFTPLLLWQSRRASGLPLGELLRSLWPAIVTGVVVLCTQWVFIRFGFWSFLPNKYFVLAASALAAGLVWIGCVRLLDAAAWKYVRWAARKAVDLLYRRCDPVSANVASQT